MANVKNKFSVFERINDTAEVYDKMADAFSVLNKINDDIDEFSKCEGI